MKESQVVNRHRTKKHNPCKNNELCFSEKYGGGGGIRKSDLSIYKTNTYNTKIEQIDASSEQNKALAEIPSEDQKQKPANVAHTPDTFLRPECAICVQQNGPVLSDDLIEVLRAWPYLPKAVKAGILAMVKTVVSE